MKAKPTGDNAAASPSIPKLGVWLCISLLLPLAASAGGTVTNCTEADFLAAAAGGGTVTFACDGTITLGQTFTNNVDTVLDATGHHVTISGGNALRTVFVNSNVTFAVVNLTIANGFAQAGGAIVTRGGNIILNGVTLSQNIVMNPTNGVDEPFPFGMGGAIYIEGGTLNATNSTFSGNRALGLPWGVPPWGANGGGAIVNAGGEVNLQSCLFTGNVASGVMADPRPNGGLAARGGAIINNGPLTADSCVFVGNAAYGGSGNYYGPGHGFAGGAAYGGAIGNLGRLVVNRCIFGGNGVSAGSGGAGHDADYGSGWPGGSGGPGGDATGGAVENDGWAYVANSTFSNNSADSGQGGQGGRGAPWMDVATGGGVGGRGGAASGSALFNSGTLALVNCTVTGGSATGGAGGQGGPGGDGHPFGGNGGAGGSGGIASGFLFGTNALVVFTNCTIALSAASGGFRGVGGPGGPGGYPGPQGPPGTNGLARGGLVSFGAILVNCLLATNAPANCSGWLSDAGHNLSSDASCAFTNAGSMNNTDPLLASLADNGGPTWTMALLPGSPAIDSGDTAAAPPTDQRGYLRPAGAAADIGAYEFGAIPPVLLTIRQTGLATLEVQGQWAMGTNQSCLLLASPDMFGWTPVATNQFGTNGIVVFGTTYDRAAAPRYYRLSVP